MNNFEYVRIHYGVPAEIGRRVTVLGIPGVIVEDRGHYIGVNYDSDRPGVVRNCHPTAHITYGEIGAVRKITRSQKRYADYLNSAHADAGMSFREYMGFK